MSRPAKEFQLEIVRTGRDGRKVRRATHIPVAIHHDIAHPDGPYFLQRLAKGRYAVTTRYDAWSFMSPVTIDASRRRVVVEDRG